MITQKDSYYDVNKNQFISHLFNNEDFSNFIFDYKGEFDIHTQVEQLLDFSTYKKRYHFLVLSMNEKDEKVFAYLDSRELSIFRKVTKANTLLKVNNDGDVTHINKAFMKKILEQIALYKM